VKCFLFSFFTWQNTIRISKNCVPLPNSARVFDCVSSLPSWFHDRLMARALTLCERVLLFISSYTCTLCPVFSLFPFLVGCPSSCTCRRKDRMTRSCTLHTCVTWSANSSSHSFFLFWYIKLYERCVEIASAVTHNKIKEIWSVQISTSEQLLWVHRWCLGAKGWAKYFPPSPSGIGVE